MRAGEEKLRCGWVDYKPISLSRRTIATRRDWLLCLSLSPHHFPAKILPPRRAKKLECSHFVSTPAPQVHGPRDPRGANILNYLALISMDEDKDDEAEATCRCGGVSLLRGWGLL